MNYRYYRHYRRNIDQPAYMLQPKLSKPSLAETHPALATEWDMEKNVPLTPADVTWGSGKKVWWRCREGHSWQAKIANRSRGIGCPICSGRTGEPMAKTLMTEWDMEKNAPLTPAEVTRGSHKKVWWRCREGHSWQTTINNRSKGKGCPICSGHTGEPLSKLLMAEWDIKKNAPLTPADVTQGSNKKVWWRCQEGHSWQAMIFKRSIGRGCPICWKQPRKSITRRYRRNIDQPAYELQLRFFKSSLAETHPALAAEWDMERNAPLTPADVTRGSDKKVWWRCGEGHSWQAAIAHRSRGRGCPICSGRTGESMAKTLMTEWDMKKNAPLTPDDVTRGSGKKVWWRCGEDHSWQAAIASRFRGRGCPICSGRTGEPLSKTLMAEWDMEKNAPLTPADVTQGSEKKVWWRCQEGHSWQAVIAHRSRGTGCPICRSRTEELLSKPLMAEWDMEKNAPLTPADVTRGSHKKVWWRCGEDHSWQAMIANRSKGKGCPICSGRTGEPLSKTLMAEWDWKKNAPLTPADVTRGSEKKVWWRCPEGHSWQAAIYNRSKGSGCPICWKQARKSITRHYRRNIDQPAYELQLPNRRIKRDWPPFEVARQQVRAEKLSSVKDYYMARTQGKFLNLPYSPDAAYQEKGWLGWDDFLGKPKLRGIVWQSFAKAREIVQKKKIDSKESYHQLASWRQKHQLPATPSKVYTKEWKGWPDFLGKKQYPTFEQARELSRKLQVRSKPEYLKKRVQHRLPAAPEIVYKDQGWSGWKDYLGSEWPAFNEARRLARGGKFANVREYSKARQWREKYHLPSNPPVVYFEQGWAGWDDFLGKPKTRNIKWPSFEAARRLVRKQKFPNIAKYREAETWRIEHQLPADPANLYAEQWGGWADFLGKARSINVEWPDYKTARALVTKKGFSGAREYYEARDWRSRHTLPAFPNLIYAEEWTGWSDFRGKKKRPDFDIARKLTRRKGFSNYEDYQRDALWRTKHNLPYNPDRTYAKEGWAGWADFLGKSRY